MQEVKLSENGANRSNTGNVSGNSDKQQQTYLNLIIKYYEIFICTRFYGR